MIVVGWTDKMAAPLLVSYSYTRHVDAPRIRTALKVLSPEECTRCNRFLFESDRRDFAIAHALLRRSLSMRDEIAPEAWSFTRSEQGKPVLCEDLQARTRLHFSLAHTHGLVVCAVARDRELGIDVESVARHVDIMDIAAHYFSPAEVEQLQSCEGDIRRVRFTEIWTLKEAYVKAIGRGLSIPLKDFTFGFEGETGLRFEPPTSDPPDDWRFLVFGSFDDYRLALALECRAPRHALTVRLESFDPPPAMRPPTLLRASHSRDLSLQPEDS